MPSSLAARVTSDRLSLVDADSGDQPAALQLHDNRCLDISFNGKWPLGGFGGIPLTLDVEVKIPFCDTGEGQFPACVSRSLDRALHILVIEFPPERHSSTTYAVVLFIHYLDDG